MDIATANNTVAIVSSGADCKRNRAEYGIEPKQTASLLDTFSCIDGNYSIWCTTFDCGKYVGSYSIKYRSVFVLSSSPCLSV